jgi:drug/metabolite transporter (DMT)-like permease
VTATSSLLPQSDAAGRPLNPYLILFIAICAASTAAVFMREALDTGIPPMLVGAGRLGFAALFITPWVLSRYRRDLSNMNRQVFGLAVLGAALICVHFILVATSLASTSVFINQALLNSAPVWTALLEIAFLKARFPRLVWIGMGVTLLGSALVAVFNLVGGTASGGTIEGSLLALGGSICGAAYLVVGRRVYGKIPVVPYIWMVFGIGSAMTLVIMVLTGIPVFGHSPNGYLWLIMIAILPQLVGHSFYNYVVGYIPATIVSLTNQTITLTSGLPAFVMLGQIPGVPQLLSSAVIITGVVIAIIGQNQPGKVKSVPIAREPVQTSNSSGSLSGGKSG